MGEDFVRCYIGNIRFFTLKDVLRASGKLDEWELLEGAKFNHKQSYGYKQVLERDELLLEALAKRSVVAETKQPKVVRPSLLWNNALDIADALTLLSLARAKYHPILAVERNSGHRYSIGWGLMARQESGNWDVVSIDNLGQFVSGALSFIEHNPAWLKETGFIPSLYWCTQAQLSHLTAPTVLEMALYWVGVETLAVSHIKRRRLATKEKKQRVKRFISDSDYTGKDWDFLDEVIDDWYRIRNTLFHEGEQSVSASMLTKRYHQVRDFVSLVFVEMLQRQDDARRKEIAARIRSY